MASIEQAKLALSLMDLTSLNDNDTDQSIISLCSNAISEHGQVAAVCVYPQFIETALDSLHTHHAKGVKVATVTNFPHGKNDPALAQKETEKAVFMGAHEIDVVFLTKNYEVKMIYRNLKPWRQTRLVFGANQVLELKGGAFPANINVGDVLDVCTN